MPKREPKKCRQWERERRDRLKNSFNGLSKVLPSYDPSITLSKLDILKGATSYIKDLQTLNKKVISGDKSLHDDLKTDLQMLDTRIQKLINRNEQLVALLQNAGIRVPTELKVDKEFYKQKLWSNKITKEKADILAEQINNAEKENKESKKVGKKVGTKLKTGKIKSKNNENIVKKVRSNKKRKKVKTLEILHVNNAALSSKASSQLINVTCYTSSSKSILSCNKSAIQASTSTPNNFFPSQQSFIVNNSTIPCKNAIVTNSTLLSTPIMATGVASERSISSLGPGTLILANGTVYPILPNPTPATIIQPSTLLVTNTSPNNPTLLVVGKPSTNKLSDLTKTDKKLILKQYPRIAIKRPGITKTTTVNKVPIPALTSKFGVQKVVGKENQKKILKISPVNTQKSKDPDELCAKTIKRRTTTPKEVSFKECDCTEKENKSNEEQQSPPKKVQKLDSIEKNTERENKISGGKCVVKFTNEEPKIIGEENIEKKIPVSNYSVDSLCNSKKDDASKGNEIKSKSIDTRENNVQKDSIVSLESTPTEYNSISAVNPFPAESIKKTIEVSKSFQNNLSSPVESFNNGSFLNTTIKRNSFETPKPSQSDNSSKETSTSDIRNSISIQTSNSLCETSSKITSLAAEQFTKTHENLTLSLPQNPDFSNDIFSSLHVPTGSHHHPESISPTAAFLLAFPLVSTLTGGKITENVDDDNSESQHDETTPPTLLQIGNIESKHSENQISFDNIPNFYKDFTQNDNLLKSSQQSTKSVPKKVVEKIIDPFSTPIFKTKSSKSKEIKASTTNILDSISTNTLIPEIPAFQNHIFNYEHTPVTYNMSSQFQNKNSINSKQSVNSSMKKVESLSIAASSSTIFPTNSSTDVNYSETMYPISNATSISHSNIPYSSSTTSLSSMDLQIVKTASPYISKITTTNSYKNDVEFSNYKRDQFKYPDFKLHDEKVKCQNTTPVVSSSSSQKPLVNWMTTPAIDSKLDTILPDFRVSDNKTSSKYFHTNNKYFDESLNESRNYSNTQTDENLQFPWSTTSTGVANIPPSTLPMLMGDLALSTTTTYTFGKYETKDFHNMEDYYNKKMFPKQQTYSSGNTTNKEQVKYKPTKQQVAYTPENPTNSFLSVSQLVDHNKTDPSSLTGNQRGNNKPPSTIINTPRKVTTTNQHQQRPIKRPSKTDQKPQPPSIERYSCSKESTFSHIDPPYDTNWINKSQDTSKNTYKNCSSTYSAEALISGQSTNTNNYQRTNLYPVTTQQYASYSSSKRLHPHHIGTVPTFDPMSFYSGNEYPTQDTTANYYPQNSNNTGIYHQSNNFTTTNFPGNMAEFETGENYNTPSIFPPTGVSSNITHNQIKSCAKTKDSRKITNVPNSTMCPSTNQPIKRNNNKRKQNVMEPSSATTTTLPGFSDLGFLSISSTNSPSLLSSDDPFHVPNLFNTSNNTNPSQIYPNSYSKSQQNHDHLITTTYTSCNLLPPLTSTSVALTTPRNPTTQSMVSASPGIASSAGNTLANFNLSTIFPEINKPVVSGGSYESSTYHHRSINNNLPNLLPQQNCGNYTNLQ